jgi:hypothetical protein
MAPTADPAVGAYRYELRTNLPTASRPLDAARDSDSSPAVWRRSNAGHDDRVRSKLDVFPGDKRRIAFCLRQPEGRDGTLPVSMMLGLDPADQLGAHHLPAVSFLEPHPEPRRSFALKSWTAAPKPERSWLTNSSAAAGTIRCSPETAIVSGSGMSTCSPWVARASEAATS